MDKCFSVRPCIAVLPLPDADTKLSGGTLILLVSNLTVALPLWQGDGRPSMSYETEADFPRALDPVLRLITQRHIIKPVDN